MSNLLKSRKFWLSIAAILQTVIGEFAPGITPEVTTAINVVLLWLVGMITVEDAAAKFHGNHPAQSE